MTHIASTCNRHTIILASHFTVIGNYRNPVSWLLAKHTSLLPTLLQQSMESFDRTVRSADAAVSSLWHLLRRIRHAPGPSAIRAPVCCDARSYADDTRNNCNRGKERRCDGTTERIDNRTDEAFSFTINESRMGGAVVSQPSTQQRWHHLSSSSLSGDREAHDRRKVDEETSVENC